jgi:ferredoxin
MAEKDWNLSRRRFMIAGSAAVAASTVLKMSGEARDPRGAEKVQGQTIYTIEPTCVGCHYCFYECPASAISWGDDKYEQDQTKCIHCGTCASVCNIGAAHAVE